MKKITIELTEEEADILTDFIADMSYLDNPGCTVNELFGYRFKYRYGTAGGKTIDKLWARIAFKIGKTDSE